MRRSRIHRSKQFQCKLKKCLWSGSHKYLCFPAPYALLEGTHARSFPISSRFPQSIFDLFSSCCSPLASPFLCSPSAVSPPRPPWRGTEDETSAAATYLSTHTVERPTEPQSSMTTVGRSHPSYLLPADTFRTGLHRQLPHLQLLDQHLVHRQRKRNRASLVHLRQHKHIHQRNSFIQR